MLLLLPMNKMQTVRIEKVTLNIGAGKDQARLGKAIKLLKHITGIEPVKTVASKRIPSWGLRPGLPIGCKLTLRKGTEPLIKQCLAAKENVLSLRNFDNSGNISFGIHEYIDVPGIKYDPDIGIIGFQLSITLERPGYRVKRRRIQKAIIGKHHQITQQDAVSFMKQQFQIKLKEEEQA